MYIMNIYEDVMNECAISLPSHEADCNFVRKPYVDLWFSSWGGAFWGLRMTYWDWERERGWEVQNT